MNITQLSIALKDNEFVVSLEGEGREGGVGREGGEVMVG